MKAAILGVGTELTDGQIFNKNASWISKKLKSLGLTTNVQLVVPDERSLMREGLEFCAAKGDLLFITGGLGPTSDDFTRDIISEWAHAPLQFDEKSWIHVSERLTSRGYTVKEIQRQQCYFPQGARVLTNSEGTANAFFLEVRGKKVFVLPGPPREIEAVWNDWISPWLSENTKKLDPFLTRSWDTIGVGESDVALAIEDALKTTKKQNLQIGYRVHMPYVEVKLSYLKSHENKMTVLVEKITEALKFCTITRDEEDILTIFSKKIDPIESIYLEDQVTGTFLLNRLLPGLRKFISQKNWIFSNSPTAMDASLATDSLISKSSDNGNEKKENTSEHSVHTLMAATSTMNSSSIANTTPTKVYLKLLPKDQYSCEVSLETQTHKARNLITTPYKIATMHERSQQYFAEMALIFWSKNL